MAQDSDKPTAADKGKGKAVENGKPEDVPKDKDGKPLANGKKADEKDECMRPVSLASQLHTQTDMTHSQPRKSSVRRISNSRASLTCLSRG
jgi:26S proteasome regulatory subunit N1